MRPMISSAQGSSSSGAVGRRDQGAVDQRGVGAGRVGVGARDEGVADGRAAQDLVAEGGQNAAGSPDGNAGAGAQVLGRDLGGVVVEQRERRAVGLEALGEHFPVQGRDERAGPGIRE